MREDVKQALTEFKVPTFGNKENIKFVEKLLNSTEKVQFISPTNCIITTNATKKKEKLPGIVALTNERFIFSYRAFADSIIESLLLGEISAVNCHSDIISSHIEIMSFIKTYDFLVQYKKEGMQKVQATFDRVIADSKNHAPAAQSPDILGQIDKLAELKEKGVISDEEFQSKKTELLSRL